MFFVMMAKDVNQKYLYMSYSIIVYFIAVFAITTTCSSCSVSDWRFLGYHVLPLTTTRYENEYTGPKAARLNKCLYGKFESMQQHKIKAIHYYTHGTE